VPPADPGQGRGVTLAAEPAGEAPAILLVVAAAENGTIGREGDLPWRLPRDLKRFKRLTKGHPMIMGRKTWESIGKKPLPKRPTVVVTRQEDYELPEGVARASDVPSSLALAATLGPPPVIVAGGAGIYERSLVLADALELTRVHAEVEGDTRFPLEALEGWELVASERHEPDEKHALAHTFETWRPTLAPEGRQLLAHIRHGETSQADLREWALDLEPFGDEACVVAALAAGRLLRDSGDHSEDTPTVEALAASEFLLAQPSALAERRAREAWGRETGWALSVEWAELAAEVVHRAGWSASREACLDRVRGALSTWAERRHALGEPPVGLKEDA